MKKLTNQEAYSELERNAFDQLDPEAFTRVSTAPPLPPVEICLTNLLVQIPVVDHTISGVTSSLSFLPHTKAQAALPLLAGCFEKVEIRGGTEDFTACQVSGLRKLLFPQAGGLIEKIHPLLGTAMKNRRRYPVMKRGPSYFQYWKYEELAYGEKPSFSIQNDPLPGLIKEFSSSVGVWLPLWETEEEILQNSLLRAYAASGYDMTFCGWQDDEGNRVCHTLCLWKTPLKASL